MQRDQTITELLAEIDAYLATSGMTASAFGHAVSGSRALVQTMRSGRVPRLTTLNRIREFMRTGIRLRENAPRSVLLVHIESFVARRGMTCTAFGFAATGDGCLVANIRAGREPRAQTVARVHEFMKTGKRYESPNRPPRGAADTNSAQA